MTGYGTGGTLGGAGRVIKAARSDTKIVVTEPAAAAMVASGERPEKGVSHPAWSPHPIQGWSPDFVSTLMQVGTRVLALCARTLACLLARLLVCALFVL